MSQGVNFEISPVVQENTFVQYIMIIIDWIFGNSKLEPFIRKEINTWLVSHAYLLCTVGIISNKSMRPCRSRWVDGGDGAARMWRSQSLSRSWTRGAGWGQQLTRAPSLLRTIFFSLLFLSLAELPSPTPIVCLHMIDFHLL